MTPGNMAQVRHLYSDSGLVIPPGSPVTTATGLLRAFIIDSTVPSSDFVPLTYLQSRILLPSQSFFYASENSYYRFNITNIWLLISVECLKACLSFFHKTMGIWYKKAYYAVDLCATWGNHVLLNRIRKNAGGSTSSCPSLLQRQVFAYFLTPVSISVKWE